MKQALEVQGSEACSPRKFWNLRLRILFTAFTMRYLVKKINLDHCVKCLQLDFCSKIMFQSNLNFQISKVQKEFEMLKCCFSCHTFLFKRFIVSTFYKGTK